jgi:hypothetical protein
VCDTIELFDTFSIEDVPIEKNTQDDALIVVVATFQPSVSDNFEHW